LSRKRDFALVSQPRECYERTQSLALVGGGLAAISDLTHEVFMADRKSYDQQLRAIGQSLEAQRITVFELRRRGDQYLVKGQPEKETSLLAVLRE